MHAMVGTGSDSPRPWSLPGKAAAHNERLLQQIQQLLDNDARTDFAKAAILEHVKAAIGDPRCWPESGPEYGAIVEAIRRDHQPTACLMADRHTRSASHDPFSVAGSWHYHSSIQWFCSTINVLAQSIIQFESHPQYGPETLRSLAALRKIFADNISDDRARSWISLYSRAMVSEDLMRTCGTYFHICMLVGIQAGILASKRIEAEREISIRGFGDSDDKYQAEYIDSWARGLERELQEPVLSSDSGVDNPDDAK